MRISLLVPVLAALALAACGDESEQSQIPELNEYDSPVPQAPEEEVAADVPTDLTPTQDTAQAVEDAADAVAQAAERVAGVAAEQLNELASDPNVQSAVEGLSGAAQSLGDQVTEQLSSEQGQAAIGVLNALVGEAATAVEGAAQAIEQQVATVAPDVDWQSTYAAEVPFYNLSDAPVQAFTQPDPNSAAVGDVAPGSGGFIETCNATLDWCLIPFGEDGQTGWVDMQAFGGVAN